MLRNSNKLIFYQSYFITTLSIVLGLMWPARSLAQFISLPEPTEIYSLATPQKINIPPLAQSEITPASMSESVSEGNLLAPPRFNIVVTRELPGLWQMRVPLDQLDSLYATYELKAQNGVNNAVSSQERSDSAMRVVVEPLPIIEVSRDLNSNTAVVQGGVRLQMDISTNQVAGAYSGAMTVTVDQRR
jgi:hypothetical protein